MTKFHEDTTKIIDFLLTATFKPCPIFYASPSIVVVVVVVIVVVVVVVVLVVVVVVVVVDAIMERLIRKCVYSRVH